MSENHDHHSHTQGSTTWLTYLAAVIILVGLLAIPGHWLMGRWKHHQAIEELKKVCRIVEVVTPDSGFKGWVCRRFGGKLAFAFERVTRIDADSVKLNKDQWQLLELFPEVEHLNLHYTNITDAELAHLSGLTNLKSLVLQETQITDAGLFHLSGLTNLEYLWLEETQITDAGLPHLSGLTNLEYLWLGKTKITDAGLSHLSGLTNLKVLHLDQIKITDAAINRLKKKIPGLEVFNQLFIDIPDFNVIFVSWKFEGTATVENRWRIVDVRFE